MRNLIVIKIFVMQLSVTYACNTYTDFCDDINEVECSVYVQLSLMFSNLVANHNLVLSMLITFIRHKNVTMLLMFIHYGNPTNIYL